MSMPRTLVLPWYRLTSPEVQRYLDYVSFAKWSAINMKPNYLQAVDEYNRGVPLTEPWFNRLFWSFNQYFQQGQAAPGRLTPALGAAALKQWGVDEAPSAREEMVSQAITAVAGGVILAVAGGVVYGALTGPSETANFTAAASSSSEAGAGATGFQTSTGLLGNTSSGLSSLTSGEYGTSLANSSLSTSVNTGLNTALGTTGETVTEGTLTSQLTSYSAAQYASKAGSLSNLFDQGKQALSDLQKYKTQLTTIKAAISGPPKHSPLAPRPPVTNVPTPASQQPPTVAQSGILPYLAIAALFLL